MFVIQILLSGMKDILIKMKKMFIGVISSSIYFQDNKQKLIHLIE